MRRKYQNQDPYTCKARFNSTCHTCGKPILKGDNIIVWPATSSAGHILCDADSYRRSVESFIDEEILMRRP